MPNTDQNKPRNIDLYFLNPLFFIVRIKQSLKGLKILNITKIDLKRKIKDIRF